MSFSLVGLRPRPSAIAALSLIFGVAALSACVHPADPCRGESYSGEWDQESLLGVTPEDVIAPFQDGHQVLATSPTRQGSEEISFSLTQAYPEIRVYDEEVADHPNCSDELRLPVQVHFATADGALDEYFESDLTIRLDREEQEVRQIRHWIPAEHINGDWSSPIDPDSMLHSIKITINFDGEETSGDITEGREDNEGRHFNVVWSW